MSEYRISIFYVLEFFNNPRLHFFIQLTPTTMLKLLLLVLEDILFQRVNDKVDAFATILGQ